MTTLHDRLGDLADEAPTNAEPDGLWATGRRLHRRQRAGTAVVLVTVAALLGGLAGLSWSQGRVQVEPAGLDTELGMPDQIWLADGHLPGTDETGPIGPLVAVVPNVREQWIGDASNGLVGISATGEYAFLDLPRRAEPAYDAGRPALSADGRYLAYWLAGRPSGEPGDLDGDPVVGVGVYDTVTGVDFEYTVETEHGLGPENLVWADGLLWFDVWQVVEPRDDGFASKRMQVVAWAPTSDEATVWERRDRDIPDLYEASTWQDSVVTVTGRSVVGTSRDGLVSWGRFADRLYFRSPLYISPDGSLGIAQQNLDDDRQPNGPLLVGRVGAQSADLPELDFLGVPQTGEVPVDELLGWRDDTHVVAYMYGPASEADLRMIDVTTGESTTLGYAEGNQPTFASNALRGPVFEAPEPPTPLNPFLVSGAAASVLLAAGLALLWWRRRVQR